MIVFPNLPFYFETLSTGERGRIFRIKRKWSTIFLFSLNPVLYDGIFLCRTFTRRTTGIYSNIIAPTENSGKIKSAVILRLLSEFAENLLYYK